MAPSWNGTEEKGRGAELEVAKIIQSSPLGKSPNGLHTFLYLMSSLSSVSPRELLFFFFYSRQLQQDIWSSSDRLSAP